MQQRRMDALLELLDSFRDEPSQKKASSTAGQNVRDSPLKSSKDDTRPGSARTAYRTTKAGPRLSSARPSSSRKRDAFV